MADLDLETGLEKPKVEACGQSTNGSSTRIPSFPTSIKGSESSSRKIRPQLWARVLSLFHKQRSGEPEKSKESGESEESAPRTRVQKVHGGPLGYPLFARFQDSEDNYMLYRRFGEVQARLLLEAQDDVGRMETKLHHLDRDETQGDDEDRLCTRKLNNKGSSPERVTLMQELKTAFKDYAELMAASQTLVSLNRPSSADYTSVTNFVWNEKPVTGKECEWVEYKEDLVSLCPSRDYAWLDATLEKLLKRCDGWLVQKLFVSKETAGKKGSREGGEAVEVYFTRSRIAMCVNFIITLLILAMIIAPIWILYHITNTPTGTPQDSAACMGVLLVFTLLFSAGLSFFTSAKRHEILAAAAAYCAVLVVFIGNVGTARVVGHG